MPIEALSNINVASDYFDKLFEWAMYLIEQDLAYVDSQSSEDIANQKGTPTSPGINSSYRNRGIKKNMQLFWKNYDK